MSAELIQNLIHTAYSTFDHNQSVLAYFVGVVICTVLAIWKPNRFSILMLIGFALLGFGFEYDKHFVGPLTRQTLAAIVQNPDTHYRASKAINIFLGEVLPIVFYLLGWGAIFSASLIGTKNFGPKPPVKVNSNVADIKID